MTWFSSHKAIVKKDFHPTLSFPIPVQHDFFDTTVFDTASNFRLGETKWDFLHLLCADLRTMQFSNAIRKRRRRRRRRRSRKEREDAGKKTCLNDPGVRTMLMTLTWMPLHYYDNNYFLLVESSIWEWFEVKWMWGDKRERRKGKIGRRRELGTNLQLGPTGKVMQFWKKDQQNVLS